MSGPSRKRGPKFGPSKKGFGTNLGACEKFTHSLTLERYCCGDLQKLLLIYISPQGHTPQAFRVSEFRPDGRTVIYKIVYLKAVYIIRNANTTTKTDDSGIIYIKRLTTGMDVTLADYANSSVSSGKGRLRKAKATFDVVREVKHLNIEDKAWDEKLEEFEGDFDFVKEENEDGEEVFVMKRTSRRKKTLSESMADKAGGNTYPLDVWHLISRYIRPEDVARFSAICKNSWSVVNTPTFWFGLYKRHYKSVPNLPTRLRPECMVRHYGLKACVVRSLFYMYPPLVARVDGPSMGTPYDLKNRQCISLWQERHSSKWRLSFKLRRKDCQPNRNAGTQDLMEILGDIFANADEGCTILQVVATERMPILPTVMGLTLHSISMSLDITMAHMHVQLVFGSGRVCNGKLDPTGTVALSIKTVTQVCVLDWWHPRYPYSTTIIRHGSEDM